MNCRKNRFQCLLLAIATVIAVHAIPVQAATAREELKQLIGQLQGNPNDYALRERIIELAKQIKPAPTIPEETQRRMARGAAAFKGAKSESDYQDAVREFEQAALAAPWSADAYYNLGVAQDKAGDHAAAVRSLKLALLAAPGSQETKNLLYEVEYRLEKANSPEARAAREREKQEAFLRSLDGARFVDTFDGPYSTTEYIYEVQGNTVVCTLRLIRLKQQALSVEGLTQPGQSKEEWRKSWRDGQVVVMDEPDVRQWITISPDGQTLMLWHKIGNGAPQTSSSARRQ